MVLPHQKKVDQFYNSLHVQIFVAFLIGANFLTNIVEKEIDPHGVKHEDIFGAFELFYNVCFTIELVINMYAHWLGPFWRSGWNIFDTIVVSIGIINMLKLPLPSAFSMLRMMRAFRVFRLFKRVHSLNKIIVAIGHAIPGVVNAFLILIIVMSIYAILAVEFYYEIGNDCKEPGGDKRFETIRGYCAGEEYFGTFSKSLYSFFQVLTGESWSEAVARPAIWFYYDDPLRAIGSGFFFVSYVLVTAFVLTNVVVAVLLDKFSAPEVQSATEALAGGGEEGEEGDGGAKGDGGTLPNGKDALPDKPTSLMLQQAMASLTSQVEQLMANSERMNTELDSFRGDMTTIREQVTRIIQCVPSV